MRNFFRGGVAISKKKKKETVSVPSEKTGLVL